MSKINIIPLGGVQEVGKNLYVIEIDNNSFIVDVGLKYPSSDLRGIDCIINDTSYIEANIHRFRAIFLTNASNTALGGVSFLVKNYRIKVYASKFTIKVLKAILLEDGIENPDELLVEIDAKNPVSYDSVVIRPFEVPYSLPESFGYSFKTNDGYFIFALDYNFDQNSKINYSYMYRELAVFAKDGVTALITSSLGAINVSSRGTILELSLRIKNIMAGTNGRIIASVNAKDIKWLQNLCDVAIEYNRKIAIIGRKNQKLISVAMDMGYLKIPEESFVNLRYITENSSNDISDLLVIVPGERNETFNMLRRMAKGTDRLIHINENDTILLLNKAEIGTERLEAKTLDSLYKATSNIKTFNEALLPDSEANREEIKQMINILKPKYLIPVLGEYRHQYSFKNAAKSLDFKDDMIIIPDNGDVLSFVNGIYRGSKASVTNGEILIDGKAIDDVADVVIKDREVLAQDGLIIISANINPRQKQVICGPEVVTRGFIFIKDNIEVIETIKQIFNDVSKNYLSQKFVNWIDYKNGVKEAVAKYIYKEIKRTPIIVPVLISVEGYNK